MHSIPTLDSLGPRICVMGPSNSGQSTLAEAISRKLSVPVVHLDQLCHLPQTDWQTRPEDEFRALHDAAAAQDAWVIDGNYSRHAPGRLARATGLILLDVSMPRSLIRYLRRTLIEHGRIGGLDGGKDSLKWEMIRYIVFDPKRSRRQRAERYPELKMPKMSLPSKRAIAEAYRIWNIPPVFRGG